jgi:tetratricopeptide (TPR) repeat protein
LIKKYYLFFSIPLVIGITIMLYTTNAVAVNLWSLKFLQQEMGDSHPLIALPEPPRGHKRSALWLAREALQAGDAEGVERLIEQLASRGNEEALSLLGAAKEAQGDFLSALEAWRLANDTVSLKDAAERATQAGKLHDALLAYRTLQELDPGPGTVVLAEFLSWAYGDYEEMELVLREALLQHPESLYRMKWTRLLGDSLAGQGEWEEAEVEYRRVLTEAPADWAAHIALGWVNYECGRGFESAMTEFLRGITLEPNQGDGYFAIGEVLTREKRYSEADFWFEQALHMNPQIRSWYMSRANAALLSGDLLRALEVYKDVLSLYPDYVEGYYEISWIYCLENQYELAAGAIQQAINMVDITDERLLVRAGEIYEKAGDYYKAKHFYQSTLAIDPDNDSAKEGLSRLDRIGE